MKLFQRLLVAPAALGLLAPVAASAAELNIQDVSSYSSSSSSRSAKKRVQGMSQFSDVYPTDWTYKALSSMLERNGCAPLTSNGSMTRYEAAALLNKCLGNVAQANVEDRRLINEFSSELAVIKGSLNNIEAGISAFGSDEFSTTTKLSGSTNFIVGGVSRGTDNDKEAVTFVYHTEFETETSFTGTDLLYTALESGNYIDSDPFGCSGDVALENCISSGNALNMGRMYYTSHLVRILHLLLVLK